MSHHIRHLVDILRMEHNPNESQLGDDKSGHLLLEQSRGGLSNFLSYGGSSELRSLLHAVRWSNCRRSHWVELYGKSGVSYLVARDVFCRTCRNVRSTRSKRMF